MGASVGAPGRKSGRRRRGVPRYGAMAEINMTPFIDVMLVLLIIFMVAAPLLATGVPIDLPQTKAAALNIEQKPVSIAIYEKGGIFLMDQPVQADHCDRLGCDPADGREICSSVVYRPAIAKNA
jgi:biopolymer transport protein TolR